MPKNEYWYFRFTQKFLTDRAVQNMKHLPLYGYQFIVIYLELCALSLPTGGRIMIPRTASERGYAIDLARDIGEEPEVTGNAISYLLKVGLVEILESPEYVEMFIPGVENNIGKSSAEADRVRASERKRRLSQEKEHKLLESKKASGKAYGTFSNVVLTDDEYEDLERHFARLEDVIKDISLYKKAEGLDNCNDYEMCRDYAKSCGLSKDNDCKK